MNEQEMDNMTPTGENHENTEVITEQTAKDNTEESKNAVPYEEPSAHQVPQDSPYSPLYNPYKNKQKKGNTLTVILIILLGLFLVAALVFAVSKVVESAMSEIGSSAEKNKLKTKIEEFLEDKEPSKGKSIGDIYNGHGDEQETQDDSREDTYDDWEDNNTEEYQPSETDDYYVELADAINDNLSYSVEMEEYSYYDGDQKVSITITYPQVSGSSVKNLDYINSEIEDAAKYYMKNFASHPENGEVSNCYIDICGYVTYMDESMLSIVLDEKCTMTDIISYCDLYSMNFDMETGHIIDNSGILDYSKKLGKAFRKQSEYQNGDVEGVNMLSDEEIADYLQDPESGIIFYTPVGLEIGYNYYRGETPGWVTVTLKNYSDYIKKI